MSLAVILSLFDELLKLGLTPPIQAALTAFFAKALGVQANVLDAAIQASVDAPPPKEG